VDADFAAGRCDAFTAYVSELGALRGAMKDPGAFGILREQISREPLAQIVRDSDIDLLKILRWTIFAMIAAEEFGVTSVNVAQQRTDGTADVRRLLGATPGNGKALGLDDAWAFNVIKTIGNYGEVYEKNVGMKSAIRLPRGLNALPSGGGLMFAPPLR
jgi:general L-amino acid transport system substrate-binding protein